MINTLSGRNYELPCCHILSVCLSPSLSCSPINSDVLSLYTATSLSMAYTQTEAGGLGVRCSDPAVQRNAANKAAKGPLHAPSSIRKHDVIHRTRSRLHNVTYYNSAVAWTTAIHFLPTSISAVFSWYRQVCGSLQTMKLQIGQVPLTAAGFQAKAVDIQLQSYLAHTLINTLHDQSRACLRSGVWTFETVCHRLYIGLRTITSRLKSCISSTSSRLTFINLHFSVFYCIGFVLCIDYVMHNRSIFVRMRTTFFM